MDRPEAQRLLGVGDDVDMALLKRRFRLLAGDLHPDRGGDPAAFHDVRRAFALLRDELERAEGAPRRPPVGRGNPSRTDDASAARRALDATLDPIAQELVHRVSTARSVRLVSRAPGALGNRFATWLDPAVTSSLLVTVACDDARDGRPSARLELTARTRPARRAVGRLDLSRLRSTDWTRRRADAMVSLDAVPRLRQPDDMTLALVSVVAVVELLGILAWPLDEWRPERTIP